MSEYMFKTYIANGREYFIYSDDVSDDHFTQKIDFPFSESLFFPARPGHLETGTPDQEDRPCAFELVQDSRRQIHRRCILYFAELIRCAYIL